MWLLTIKGSVNLNVKVITDNKRFNKKGVLTINLNVNVITKTIK